MMLGTWEICEKNNGKIMIDRIESCFSPRKWYSTRSKYSKLAVSWPISKIINASFHDYTYSAKVTRGQWSISFHILKKNFTVKIQPILFFFRKFVSVMSYPRNFIWSFTIIKTKITHIFEVLYFNKMHIDVNLFRQKYTKEKKIQKICGRDYKIIYNMIWTSIQLI